jgi:hypothetical protein
MSPRSLLCKQEMVRAPADGRASSLGAWTSTATATSKPPLHDCKINMIVSSHIPFFGIQSDDPVAQQVTFLTQ